MERSDVTDKIYTVPHTHTHTHYHYHLSSRIHDDARVNVYAVDYTAILISPGFHHRGQTESTSTKDETLIPFMVMMKLCIVVSIV